MDIVMNNDDLRREIWKYLRSKAFKKCLECNSVCMWNKKKINLDFVSWNKFINCHCCFRKNFLKNTIYIASN